MDYDKLGGFRLWQQGLNHQLHRVGEHQWADVKVIKGAHNVITNDVGDVLGRESIRCVYLGTNAVLSGFTLTNGMSWLGGGVFCEVAAVVTNSMLTGNSATGGGGGEGGGGASGATLYNCTLTSNSAECGGAAASWSWSDGQCILFNCIVYYNSGGNYDVWAKLDYCCTTPLPTNGIVNITGPPLFMDMAGGDFRLQEDSPCIDAGTNLILLNVGYTYEPTGFLGDTRLIDGNFDGKAAWDIGAYEFNPYRFGPALQLTANGLVFTVRGEPGKSVRIERSRDLLKWEWTVTVPIPVSGQTLIDPAAATEPFLFYRAVSVP